MSIICWITHWENYSDKGSNVVLCKGFLSISKVPDHVGFRKTGSSTICTTSVLLLMLSTTRIDFIVPVRHPGGHNGYDNGLTSVPPCLRVNISVSGSALDVFMAVMNLPRRI